MRGLGRRVERRGAELRGEMRLRRGETKFNG